MVQPSPSGRGGCRYSPFVRKSHCVILSAVFLLYVFLLLSLILPAPAANERLQRTVDAAMSNRRGAAVALDVETGQILAGYRMDVAARRLAAPGSTIKPFTLMALLDAGLVHQNTALFCPRTVRIGNHVLDCSHPKTPESLDPVLALAYSCNYFFTKMTEGLTLDALPREFSRAGFGSITGKWPTELPSTIEPPKSKQGMQLMSIGEENIKVTPLTLAEGYRSAIARPLRNPETAPPDLQIVLTGLEAVVNSGTGQAAKSSHVRVAGKTGTFSGHAWFAGFAPAGKPEIVIVVFLEHGTGAADAAPIAGRILDGYYAPHP